MPAGWGIRYWRIVRGSAVNQGWRVQRTDRTEWAVPNSGSSGRRWPAAG